MNSLCRPQSRSRVARSQSMAAGLICVALACTVSAQSARIKRISLMTPDLDRSIAFFTEVVGFTLDFEGTLLPGGEPFLGPVFNIDASKPIRRALLSTRPRREALSLIEHSGAPGILTATARRRW